MKLLVSVFAIVASIPVFVIAQNLHVGARHIPNPRRSSSGVVSSATTASGISSSPVIAQAAASAAPTPSLSFSLASVNPTAIPLASIVSNAPTQTTLPLATTYTAGSQPTFLPGAPPLPNAALLVPSKYPALDVPPPTDSPEVQQWISEVAASGITIPNITQTVLGGCPANLAAAGDKSRCWWTCGGCTRDTDVTTCPDKMTWGLTYDDGPSFYTSNLMDYLDEQNLKSTFFVVGSRVISFPATLQEQYMDQHQIAVHTWSHPSLTTLSNDQIIAELGWSKKVIKDVLGVTPNMMRPPFGDIDDRVRAISVAMGLTPVMWTRISPLATFDTNDFDIHGGLTTVNQVLENWEHILGNATEIPTGFIVLEHDLFQQTVDVATGYILPDALAHQPPFKIQPVIECLNRPMTDAYIELNDNSTNPPVSGLGSSAAPSSGSPGSAQATGAQAADGSSTSASGSSSSSSTTAPLSAALGITVLTAIGGFMAGAGAVLF